MLQLNQFFRTSITINLLSIWITIACVQKLYLQFSKLYNSIIVIFKFISNNVQF